MGGDVARPAGRSRRPGARRGRRRVAAGGGGALVRSPRPRFARRRDVPDGEGERGGCAGVDGGVVPGSHRRAHRPRRATTRGQVRRRLAYHARDGRRGLEARRGGVRRWPPVVIAFARHRRRVREAREARRRARPPLPRRRRAGSALRDPRARRARGTRTTPRPLGDGRYTAVRHHPRGVTHVEIRVGRRRRLPSRGDCDRGDTHDRRRRLPSAPRTPRVDRHLPRLKHLTRRLGERTRRERPRRRRETRRPRGFRLSNVVRTRREPTRAREC